MQYEFDIVRKGYDKEQVAEYINELLATIEGYKFKEEQTRNLVQLAEDKAKKIVEDAKQEAIRAAKEESDRIIDGAYSKLYSIQETMQEQRTLLNDFRKDYNRFILKYVNEVNKRNFVQLQTSVDDIENYITETMKAAEKTKNGYFVPNPTKTDSPIIIVEPSVSDVSSTKLQEHFVVDSNEDFNEDSNQDSSQDSIKNLHEEATNENEYFETNDLSAKDKNNDIEIIETDINTNAKVEFSEEFDKEFDQLFNLTKEETLSKHLEEQVTSDQVQEIQDTLLNIKPVK